VTSRFQVEYNPACLVSERQGITELLREWNDGDAEAAAKLIPLVYDDLRRLARNQLAKERRNYALRPTVLVHEAYLRLIAQHGVEWKNGAQFLGIIARLMRHILVEYARAHATAKRGGAEHISLDAVDIPICERGVEFLALDAALTELARVDARKSRVVELRFFGGLSIEETAGAMQINAATVRRDWTFARAWLNRAIRAAM